MRLLRQRNCLMFFLRVIFFSGTKMLHVLQNFYNLELFINLLWIKNALEKHEQLLNMLMDFNQDIRFSAVCNSKGEILWHSQRTGVKNIVPLADTKNTILRAVAAWQEREKVTSIVGRGLYTIASYEKIKRITIPLKEGNLLFISIGNAPLQSKKGKSYGHLVEMGKILSIVDFVNANN